MLFFSTIDHKRRAQQWSYKQKFLLLSYSAHLSLGVHCSSKVKKKKKIYYTSLSSLNKKTFPIFFLSLRLLSFLLSSSIFFPLLLACQLPYLPHPSTRRPAPSSLIYYANLACRPTLSPITDLPKPHRRVDPVPKYPNGLLLFSLLEPFRVGFTYRAGTISTRTHWNQRGFTIWGRTSGLSWLGWVKGWWFFLSCCGLVVVDDCPVLCWDWVFILFYFMYFHMGLVAVVVVVDFDYGSGGGWFW